LPHFPDRSERDPKPRVPPGENGSALRNAGAPLCADNTRLRRDVTRPNAVGHLEGEAPACLKPKADGVLLTDTIYELMHLLRSNTNKTAEIRRGIS
jgi:hypothetical protein